MSPDDLEKKIGCAFILFPLLGLGTLGFVVWVVIRLLMHFGVI
jgi:nitrate reductase NapE component